MSSYNSIKPLLQRNRRSSFYSKASGCWQSPLSEAGLGTLQHLYLTAVRYGIGG